jgi:integrase
MSRARRITGHLVVEERKDGPRVWVAKYMRAEGTPTRKVLGATWAKPARTASDRGAPASKRWRSADGPRPSGHLTPREAQDRLDEILSAERAKDGAAVRLHRQDHTFGEAVAAYLWHVEHVKKIAPSTLNHYRSIIRARLLVAFDEHLPLARLTATRVEGYRDELLAEDAISRSSMRQVMNVLGGILKRAQMQRWIAHNPAADVERIPVPKLSGDFNVLTPAQTEAVARAAAGGWTPVAAGDRIADGRRATRVSDRHARDLTRQRRADAIRFAAYTSLCLGELRALRWRDVVWADSLVHVRLNAPSSAPAGSAERRPKSQLVRSVPLTDEAAKAIEGLSRREFHTSPDDYVFPSPTGSIIDGKRLRDAFYRALESTGLAGLRTKSDPIVFHDLRHTFGTLAVRVAPVTDVKEWMGHADLSTTMRYVHHIPQHDAAKRLSTVFAVETNPFGVGVPASSPVGPH